MVEVCPTESQNNAMLCACQFLGSRDKTKTIIQTLFSPKWIFSEIHPEFDKLLTRRKSERRNFARIFETNFLLIFLRHDKRNEFGRKYILRRWNSWRHPYTDRHPVQPTNMGTYCVGEAGRMSIQYEESLLAGPLHSTTSYESKVMSFLSHTEFKKKLPDSSEISIWAKIANLVTNCNSFQQPPAFSGISILSQAVFVKYLQSPVNASSLR